MAIQVEERPTAGRVILGFLVAAFASVAAEVVLIASIAGTDMTFESMLGFSIFVFLFGVPIALIAILILALPAYLLMRKHWHVRWWNAALTGLIVGMVPGILLGAGTSWEALQIGLAGLVGGLAFWAVVRERPGQARIDPETFR
ncbi:hypothetical protein [Sphingosinicella sp. YJ22]|uniref:hypothetical protein n=1 Tax=Sphingosinicella sp. YJ22 TaxID=1104780 RepID=UPI00140ABAD4|nr:hypothetical protein [Sphingosinicella sp. YJ22]